MPSYSTNDPKGWCGDKRRGAALGRAPILNGPPIGAINLAPVVLDQDGYDRNGTYFGHGAPLFWYADDGGNIDACERASDVDALAEKLRERFPGVEVKFCPAVKAKCYGAGDDPCPDDADAQDFSAYCAECEVLQWELEDTEEEEAGPVPGDYTIAPTGPLGSQSALAEVEGPFIGTFDSDEEAIRAAQERMEQEQFWPNIWIISDHGNAQLWSPDNE